MPSTFHRYVALGDSFTEGVGDTDPGSANGVRGWADRVAATLAEQTDDFGYANLAIRGRKLPQVLAEQLEPALALDPDLVTLYAGGNDILRPKVDIDALLVDYSTAVGRLRENGATVVLFTGFDLGFAPVFRHLRGRVAVYNELVREVADVHGALLLDYWRLRDYRDPRLWDVDRMHMSTLGHTRMAAAVLDLLGADHDLRVPELPPRAPLSAQERRTADAAWVKAHAAPWVRRRLTGTSSGDGLAPKRPGLAPVER